MDGRSITPARRLDAAPAELRASSTRQTITARPSTSARSSTDRSVEIRERRYGVRLESAGGAEVGMTVIDEDGKVLELRGLRQYERRYLELLVREVD